MDSAFETGGDADGHANASSLKEASKRVRTGCLTCRQRHLKCDETLPTCRNCLKVGRPCKRGLELKEPTQDKRGPLGGQRPDDNPATSNGDWPITDNSREIAAEYPGGLALYLSWDEMEQWRRDNGHWTFISDQDNATKTNGSKSAGATNGHSTHALTTVQHGRSSSDSARSQSTTEDQIANPTSHWQLRNNPQEMLYFQVYVEEVALWMDNLNEWNFFAERLPFHAFAGGLTPGLRNAILACGAVHLYLLDADPRAEAKANEYYKIASDLVENGKIVNLEEKALVASVLSAFEVLIVTREQRINYLAKVGGYIAQCNFDASTGYRPGNACFWLNIGMEVISCLDTDRRVSIPAKDWNLDMVMDQTDGFGFEVLWFQRLFNILAQIVDLHVDLLEYRKKTQAQPSPSMGEGGLEHDGLVNKWNHIWGLLETWSKNRPSYMHVLGSTDPDETTSNSTFPELFIIKKSSVLANLYYHLAMVLLLQDNIEAPPETTPDTREKRDYNVKLLCGIVTHVKHRGIASMTLRPLSIASQFLTDWRQQQEVVKSLLTICNETGWRIQSVIDGLKLKWGWKADYEQGTEAALQQRQLESARRHEHAVSAQHQQYGGYQEMQTMSVQSYQQHQHQHQQSPPTQHHQQSPQSHNHSDHQQQERYLQQHQHRHHHQQHAQHQHQARMQPNAYIRQPQSIYDQGQYTAMSTTSMTMNAYPATTMQPTHYQSLPVMTAASPVRDRGHMLAVTSVVNNQNPYQTGYHY